MTERSVTHATFIIERSYAAAPARVFKAWADPAAKARWFAGPADKWKETLREFDFRVGGRERLSGVWPGGKVSAFDGLYHDIVPDQRIVYAYGMHLDEVRISVSLATVEFKPGGAGTRLIFTEQAVFLDGYDDSGSREQGTGTLLDRLDADSGVRPQAPDNLEARESWTMTNGYLSTLVVDFGHAQTTSWWKQPSHDEQERS